MHDAPPPHTVSGANACAIAFYVASNAAHSRAKGTAAG
ncbi:hypothetical protein Z946_2509 [Sulfitobacter noctilucicola]|nr:hypothetical protein Z946_2509 [Sulfitobacter noctilucicola]